jgi:hypothetical protein
MITYKPATDHVIPLAQSERRIACQTQPQAGSAALSVLMHQQSVSINCHTMLLLPHSHSTGITASYQEQPGSQAIIQRNTAMLPPSAGGSAG